MLFSSLLRSRDSRKREEQKWSRSLLGGGAEGEVVGTTGQVGEGPRLHPSSGRWNADAATGNLGLPSAAWAAGLRGAGESCAHLGK